MRLVDQIIAAKKQYDETDRPWLSHLADGQLKKIAASCGCAAEGDTASAAAAEATPPTAPAPTVSMAAPAPAPEATPPAAAPVAAAATPEPEKELSAEEWLEKTPPHLRDVFGDLLAQRRADEASLREQIVTQSGGKLTAEYLANKPLAELQTLCAATRKPDFSGRGVQAHDSVAQAGSKPASAPRMPGLKIGTGAAA